MSETDRLRSKHVWGHIRHSSPCAITPSRPYDACRHTNYWSFDGQTILAMVLHVKLHPNATHQQAHICTPAHGGGTSGDLQTHTHAHTPMKPLKSREPISFFTIDVLSRNHIHISQTMHIPWTKFNPFFAWSGTHVSVLVEVPKWRNPICSFSYFRPFQFFLFFFWVVFLLLLQ